jgi:hypothetical protein
MQLPAGFIYGHWTNENDMPELRRWDIGGGDWAIETQLLAVSAPGGEHYQAGLEIGFDDYDQAALNARHVTGEGQFLDVSLLESQMTWLENYAGEYFATGNEPPKRGNSHPQVIPYEPMQGSDGEWFILGVGSDNIWGKFCELSGLDDLRDDPRFHANAERVLNRDVLLPRVREAMRTRPAAEWIDRLKAADIPVGPIRNVSGALADPQVAARGVIVELEHPVLGVIKSLATPVHLSGTPVSYRYHPPQLGEHTSSLLAEQGYAAADIDGLRARGVVGKSLRLPGKMLPGRSWISAERSQVPSRPGLFWAPAAKTRETHPIGHKRFPGKPPSRRPNLAEHSDGLARV